MVDILLITNEQLIEGTPLGGNIDIDKYQSIIKETQVFVIEPILGTKLYNKILADFDAQTLEGNYLELYDKYLIPILVHSVAAEYLTIGSFTVGNGGIFRYSPQDAIPATKEEVYYLANKSRTKADVYIQRLEDYLCFVNIDEYDQAQTNNYDIDPNKNMRLTGGWKLDGYDYKGTNAYKEIWRDILRDEGKG